MKRKLLLAFFVCLNYFLYSQETYVPDDNFEAYLENIGAGNYVDNDDQVLTGSIAVITDLDISGLGISDLTGIEDFTALTNLTAISNSLTSLDLTANTNLLRVDVADNNLTSFDFRNGMNGFIQSFRAIANYDLRCITVDDASLSSLVLWNVDSAITSFNEDCVWTNVPDDNFESYLETHDADGNTVSVGDASSMGNGIANDDYVITAKITTLTSLDISSRMISDITGIEDFTALEILDFSTNGVGDFDLSSNINLKELYCASNGMSDINVTADTNLEVLDASGNFYTAVDVSSNTKLKVLNLSGSGATSLNLGTITTLEELNLSNNSLTSLDLSNLTSLRDLNCDTNYNLSITDFSALTNLIHLNCNNTDLRSLDLSSNTLLETLNIDFVSGFDVDLSGNIALTSVSAQSSDLTSLNIKNGNNANITSFDARFNQFSCIQVDDPTAEYLGTWLKDSTTSFESDCSETSIPDVDFEDYLERHDANGNFVTVGNPNSLGNGKVQDGKVLTTRIKNAKTLNIAFLSIGDLTGIEDFTALEIFNCSNNEFNDIDLSNQLNLKELYCHDVFVSTIDVSANLNLEKLIINDADCRTLTIGNNTVLKELNVHNNELTALDITNITTLEILDFSDNYNLNITDFSGLTNLTNLNCSDTGLRSIDLSANTLLEVLTMNNMSGFDVDLSGNTALTSFSANESDLSSINIQNGNNANITFFDARLNSITLNCIQVDDSNASYLSTWQKDATVVFSNDCVWTNVPDDNFENYLETHDADGNTVSVGDATSMGNGIANDDYVTTANIENVISLNINSKSIADVTGIEDFVALQDLNCFDNMLSSIDLSQNIALLELNAGNNNLISLDVSQNTLLITLSVSRNSLTNLDVSQNTALITLSCSRNQLNGLDVTNNAALKNLYCYTNPLGSLDVTQNPVLEGLDCVEGQLTSLDVSQNPKLRELQVYDNELTSLDVSNNPELIELYVEYNQLTSLDVSKNTALVDLSCFSNQLTYLNIRNGNNTNLDNRDFDITNNPGLTCVAVDDPAYATATFTKKDMQTVFNTFCSETYVPDDSFENYLETHNSNGGVVSIGDPTSLGNGIANDDYVGTEQIQNITYLNISNRGITDFTGLEAFISLGEFRAFGNTVSSLDLTANVNLTVIACSSMGLTSIDISGLTALKTLEVNANQLSTVDASSNVSLENIQIINNQLSAIDISANTALRDLRIQGNNVTAIDLSLNTQLTYLSCWNNDLTNLDVPNNTLLENLDCGENPLSTVDVSALTNLTDLFLEDTPTLTSLDVSSNTNLENIGVNGCKALETLDLSNNTKLVEVYTYNSGITALDFSSSPDLEYVECYDGALYFLNIKGRSANPDIEIYATGNPELSCIQVDDPNASYLTSWDKDATASFAEYCELTYVPNDNFEALLEARGFGNGIANDDYVYTELIAAETTLIIQDKDIADLKGIEDFTELQLLLCRRSNVETVDISNNTKLTHVNLVDNLLTGLDLSANVLLQEVLISDNPALGAVDVSALTELTMLDVSNTGINTIDVSNNPLIRVLRLIDNEFTTLDVSSYPSIVQVWITNNQLTSLNVANGNNSNFTLFDASGNPDLTCIQVDDVNGNFSLWTKDATANYAHYCELTYIVDANFENYLETHDADGNTVSVGDASSMGNGIANDNQVATSKIETVTTLNIERQDIADLTGIEAFTALESLNCDYNDLTTLDVSSNVNLKVLDAAENNLTSVDFTGHPTLEEIALRSNSIASLLVDNNPTLKVLSAGKNLLTALDVTACTQLEELAVHQNLLVSLDVRNGNNNLITDFFVLYNPDLTCILVDDPSAAYLTTWEKDGTASFSEDCTPPVITLTGDNPQAIELGDGYSELGATVDDGITNVVIDTSDFIDALGSYTIRYNATDASGNIAVEVIRTVNVVDTTAPIITLLGDNPQEIELGSGYTELGATTNDGNSVVIDSSDFMDAVGSYTIRYNAMDASGNIAVEVTRTVNVVDTIAPVITLIGDNPQTIELGSGYSELGATTDDGSNVVIDESDFVDDVGSYTIKYNATDASGNRAEEVIRIVQVVPVLSTPDQEIDKVFIAPNPAQNQFQIVGFKNQNETILIYDLNGKLLKQIKQYRGEAIDITGLNSGVYFVKLDLQNSKTYKLIKY